MELLIVTGMSGAGKSCTADALEDMGFYCVDNIPPTIIPYFVDLASCGGEKLKRIAIITDVRGGNLFSEILDVINELKNNLVNTKILFLDASNEVLIHRYKENRRKHPLCDENTTLSDAVCSERNLLSSLRARADFVIDTSYISTAQLKEKLSGIFFGNLSNVLKLQCKSFGFKYGADSEADLVFDVRCLPNPFYVEELKNKTGLDKEVREYIFASDESREYFNRLISFLDFSVPLYAKEGKSQLTLAFACTGGKHRSVTFAELVAEHLKKQNYDCVTIHRDIQKR